MYEKKRLPIGIENFEKIRREGFYFVDKTCFIRDLLYNWGEVNLFTRPRRFGKSLNMAMLKSFFEPGADKALFEGLEISKEKELCEIYMGKYPVVSVSMKSANAENFQDARSMICQIINEETIRIQNTLHLEKMTDYQQQLVQRLSNPDMSDAELMNSLRMLSALLCQYYDKKVIILIDEYDVPLAKAYERGYYDQMVILIRNMFEQAFKTNDNLQFAVMTGCLRIAKESIFTGLNNLNVLSVTDVRFDEYFGFTDREVRDMLSYYGISGAYDTIKEWYDGYRFGNIDVYCPWDVICYCAKLCSDPEALPEAYWSNTSGNDIIRHFLEKAKAMTRKEIGSLIDGEAVVKKIRQNVTYSEMYDSIDNMWSVMFMTGYLTQRGKEEDRLRLVIPNKEIKNIFIDQISEWFLDNARQDGEALEVFCEAVKDGDAENVEKRLNEYLIRTISIRDTAVEDSKKENFYHGILLGLLGYKDSWEVWSNREAGEGYADILAEIQKEQIGIVIELKYAHSGNLERACDDALKQIRDRQYEELMREDGMKKVLKYGIACYKKKCMVRVEESGPL